VGTSVTRRFVLLDRDGTINVQTKGEYILKPEQMELIPHASLGLRMLAEAGFGLIVISNQAPVARGWIDEAQLDVINARMLDLLQDDDVRLDGIHSCPHDAADGCDCRKPEPGLLIRAGADHGFDPADAFLIGDKESDILAGRRVGATTVLVLTGEGEETRSEGTRADHVANDLPAAASIIARLVQEDAG
jgi:D-glycero-D-manno-heptose 1,7-bisphosphate phosphatase